MRFVDRILLKLADSDERSAMLTNSVGERLLQAGFDYPGWAVPAIANVSVKRIDIGWSIDQVATVQGNMRPVEAVAGWEASGTITQPQIQVCEAFATLRITASTRTVETTVDDVANTDLNGQITLAAADARIATEDGGLPGDDAALDTRRLAALGDIIEDALTRPDDFDADAFMSRFGISTAQDLVDLCGGDRSMLISALDLVIEPAGDLISKDYLLDTLILAEENPVQDLQGLIERIQLLRSSLRRAGYHLNVPEGQWAARQIIPVLVYANSSTFSDADLPLLDGTDPAAPEEILVAARRSELNRRLQPLGIVAEGIST